MSKTPIQLWIDALRSGDYVQGHYALKKHSTILDRPVHCCLGVACEVYQKEVGDLEEDSRASEFGFAFDGEVSCLPPKVVNWLGLESMIGLLTETLFLPTRTLEGGNGPVNSFNDLVEINDSSNFTFGDIADLIEQGKVR